MHAIPTRQFIAVDIGCQHGGKKAKIRFLNTEKKADLQAKQTTTNKTKSKTFLKKTGLGFDDQANLFLFIPCQTDSGANTWHTDRN